MHTKHKHAECMQAIVSVCIVAAYKPPDNPHTYSVSCLCPYNIVNTSTHSDTLYAHIFQPGFYSYNCGRSDYGSFKLCTSQHCRDWGYRPRFKNTRILI